jgi:hypothetical protein
MQFFCAKEHARKQTQMHNLDQMAKKLNSEFGETFTYNKTYFGKIEGLNYAFPEVVAIEQFIKGGPFVKFMNNTENIPCHCNFPVMQKAEALAHFSFYVSKEKLLLVDIHGVGYELCDPEIASAELMSNENGGEKLNFCIGNLSVSAIDIFFYQHQCNQHCEELGLKAYQKDLKQ